MTLTNFAFLVQSIVPIMYASVVMEHVRKDVCLEVQGLGVMNHAPSTVLNVINLIIQIAKLVRMNFMVTAVNIAAAKIANHKMEFVNALSRMEHARVAAKINTGLRLALKHVLMGALIKPVTKQTVIAYLDAHQAIMVPIAL